MSTEEAESFLTEDKGFGQSERLRGLVIQPQKSPAIPMRFFLFCLVGILLILGGFIVLSWASFLDDYHQYELREDLQRSGWILTQIGGILLALGMLCAGFLARSISQNTRLGLILGATIVIGFFLMIPRGHYSIWLLL